MQKSNLSHQNLIKIRCFIAIELAREHKIDIDHYVSNLKNISPSVRWINLTNIHITLKFLGDIEQRILGEVISSLKLISEVFKPFTISIAGSGVFPGMKNPRVVWLGIKPDKDNRLITIYEWIENKLEQIGFAKEQRKFSPHLTIGRIKNPHHMGNLYDYMRDKPFPEKKLLVNEIILMQSVLKPSGAEYTILDKFS